MSKVRVLYDFVAENGNELNCYTGETLSVMNAVVYDGWIQVKNSTGTIGIVPSSYVEYLDDEDDIPPPPSAKGASSGYGGGSSWESPIAPATTASWNTPAPASSYSFDTSSFDEFDPFGSVKKEESLPPPAMVATTPSPAAVELSFAPPRLPSQQPDSGGFDDLMWSNPPPSYGGAATNTSSGGAAAAANANTQHQGRVNKNYDDDSDFDSDDDGASTRTGATNANNTNNQARSNILSNSVHNVTSGIGTLSKSKKNPYSLEAFLLHGAIKNVHDSDRFSSIVINEQRQSNWKRISPPYQVSIIGYQADKKYHGVKKFTSYEIKANIFPQRVKRRYNHFDWLHERLSEKYPNICIPPLSGKAVTGNFDDDFIAKRKSALELWLNRMSAHPVVGQSEVFIHFLQCDDGSAKWKAGKRKAEKDEYRGAQWFCTLTVPGESVDTTTGIKERVDKFAKAAAHMNSCVKNISVSLDKVAANNSTFYKKELSNLGKRFEELGITLSNDSLDAVNNTKLSTAFVSAGNCYTQLGNMYGEQAKHDIYPFLDRLQLYQGVLQQMPEIAQIEKSAIGLYEEFQQRPEKLEGRSLMEVAPRREIISHVTFAEINHFNREKVEDLTQYMKSFLQQQVQFYSEITECLKRAQAEFDKIPVFSSSNQAAGGGSATNNQSFKR